MSRRKMPMHRTARRLLERTDGAALVVVAVAIVFLVTLIALAIDLSTLAAGREKYTRAAEKGAIAALEAYVEYIAANPPPDPLNAGATYEAALDEAVERASSITGLNFENTMVVRFRKNRPEPESDFSEIGRDGAEAPDGTLIPGIWHFVERDPEVLGSVPCDTRATLDEPFRPCFEETGNDQKANAFRLVLRTRQGSPFGVLFAGNVADRHPTLRASATAALLPRRAVVAFDLSRSVTRDSHLSNDQGGIPRSEFALFVDPGRSPSAGATCQDWQSSLIRNDYPDDYPELAIDQEAFDGLASSRPADEPIPQLHYRDDYQCLTVPISRYDAAAESNVVTNESFGIDSFSSAEPLNGILNGTKTMLEEFQLRGVVGDRVGVLGFDDGLLDQRRLPRPSADPDFEPLIEPSAEQEEFTDFLAALDSANAAVAWDERREILSEYFLFPRFLGERISPSGQRRAAMTDPRLALQESLDMLRESTGFEVAENFVLLVTDGLGNCVLDPCALRANPDAPCPSECFNSTFANLNPMNQQYIEQAFSDVFTTGPDGAVEGLMSEFARNRVQLHVALIGEGVQPHVLVRKGPSGCMTSEDASAGGYPLVNADGSAYNPQSGAPFFFPNHYADAATHTGGLFSPIVDCCRGDDGECAAAEPNQQAPVASLLENACDAATTVGALITCPCDRSDPACLDQNELCRYVDEQGRLLCDPHGRSKTQQLQDLIAEIMERNPLLLVE